MMLELACKLTHVRSSLQTRQLRALADLINVRANITELREGWILEFGRDDTQEYGKFDEVADHIIARHLGKPFMGEELLYAFKRFCAIVEMMDCEPKEFAQ
jgi:hypothetical protein